MTYVLQIYNNVEDTWENRNFLRKEDDLLIDIENPKKIYNTRAANGNLYLMDYQRAHRVIQPSLLDIPYDILELIAMQMSLDTLRAFKSASRYTSSQIMGKFGGNTTIDGIAEYISDLYWNDGAYESKISQFEAHYPQLLPELVLSFVKNDDADMARYMFENYPNASDASLAQILDNISSPEMEILVSEYYDLESTAYKIAEGDDIYQKIEYIGETNPEEYRTIVLYYVNNYDDYADILDYILENQRDLIEPYIDEIYDAALDLNNGGLAEKIAYLYDII